MAACYIFIRTPYSAEPKNSHSSRAIFFREEPLDQRDVCGYKCVCVCVCLRRIAPLNCPAPLKKKLTLPTIMPCKNVLQLAKRCARLCHILQHLPSRSLYNSAIANAHLKHKYMHVQCIQIMPFIMLYSALCNLWQIKGDKSLPSNTYLQYNAVMCTIAQCGQKEKDDMSAQTFYIDQSECFFFFSRRRGFNKAVKRLDVLYAPPDSTASGSVCSLLGAVHQNLSFQLVAFI